MWQDPIVKETRELRDQYAAQFKHDLDAIFADIKQRQENSPRKKVSFPRVKRLLLKNAHNLLIFGRKRGNIIDECIPLPIKERF